MRCRIILLFADGLQPDSTSFSWSFAGGDPAGTSAEAFALLKIAHYPSAYFLKLVRTNCLLPETWLFNANQLVNAWFSLLLKEVKEQMSKKALTTASHLQQREIGPSLPGITRGPSMPLSLSLLPLICSRGPALPCLCLRPPASSILTSTNPHCCCSSPFYQTKTSASILCPHQGD